MAPKFTFFTPGEVKPLGWLRRQLELQADGLCGNLDKMWPDVRDSRWIGGTREGWERVPYWLDGFLPMAYLLGDGDRKARAQKYVEKIIENQEPDGWICPNGDTPREQYDTWAVQLIGKTLKVYFDCTGDERIPGVLLRVMKNYYDLLSAGTIRLFNWGKARWFEVLPVLSWLRERNPDAEWIPALAKLLREQGTDYAALVDRWKETQNQWTYETHIVNLTMMLKYEAVSCDLLGEAYTDVAERLRGVLTKYNATPVGLFTGDECLGGISPIRGTELCSVVEQMYSYEHLYAYTGAAKWAERLETVAFNALPATVSDDMWTHQYDQQSNQISAYPLGGNSFFGTNSPDAHIFGLEPSFGCCTANFGQGWPKLALSAFLRAKDGVAVALTLPAELSTEWKGTPVRVTTETEYPFRNTFTYRVTAEKDTDMVLRIRVPSFAKNLTVDGKPAEKCAMLIRRGFAKGETVIRVSFDVEAELVTSPSRLKFAKCGSLVFVVPVKTEWVKREYTSGGVERKFPYCDYYLYGKSDWNYAYTSDRLTRKEETVSKEVPFSAEHPPVTLRAGMCHIDWGTEPRFRNLCARLPRHRTPLDESREITLIPYGCAKLRMTEMPLVKKN